MNGNKDTIKILFFSSKMDRHFKAVLNSVPDSVAKKDIDHYTDINDFAIGLRDMLLGKGIVLTMARDENELDMMIQLCRKLNDHTSILILGNTNDELVTKALKLYPRYTSYIKQDYTDISLVMEKMITKIQKTI